MSEELEPRSPGGGSGMGLLFKVVVAIIAVVILVSMLAAIVHLLFLAAAVLVIGVVIVGAYRLGRSRGD